MQGGHLCTKPPLFLLRQPRHTFVISCTYSFLLRAVSCEHSFSQCPLIAFCFAMHQEQLGLGLGSICWVPSQTPLLGVCLVASCFLSCFLPSCSSFPSLPSFPFLRFWWGSIKKSSTTIDLVGVLDIYFFGCQCLFMVLAISLYVLNLSAVYFLISAIDSPSGLSRSGRTSFFSSVERCKARKMAVVTSDGKGCVSSLRLDKASILLKIRSAALGMSACDFAGWRFLISSQTAGN